MNLNFFKNRTQEEETKKDYQLFELSETDKLFSGWSKKLSTITQNPLWTKEDYAKYVVIMNEETHGSYISYRIGYGALFFDIDKLTIKGFDIIKSNAYQKPVAFVLKDKFLTDDTAYYDTEKERLDKLIAEVNN